jgi:hypothetical protein
VGDTGTEWGFYSPVKKVKILSSFLRRREPVGVCVGLFCLPACVAVAFLWAIPTVCLASKRTNYLCFVISKKNLCFGPASNKKSMEECI